MNQVQLFSVDGRHTLTRQQVVYLARMAELTPEELVKPKATLLRENDREIQLEREDGEVVSVFKTQDAKYGVMQLGARQFSLANLRTGMPIPPDEPVFILRAKDRCALAALESYLRTVTDRSDAVQTLTIESASAAFEAFSAFADKHPERMSWPT